MSTVGKMDYSDFVCSKNMHKFSFKFYNVTNGPRIFLLQLHTTMPRNFVSVNATVTAAPLSRDPRGKSRNFRQVNRDISRKELETKTREEIRYRGVTTAWRFQFRSTGVAKRVLPRLQEYSREIAAKVLSKSTIHSTWEALFWRLLYCS